MEWIYGIRATPSIDSNPVSTKTIGRILSVLTMGKGSLGALSTN
jgi:hypothetical protein